MRKVLPIIISVLLIASSPALARKKKDKNSKAAEQNPAALYDKAVLKYRKKDCTNAEPLFRKIIADFPYSRFAPLSELRIADCQFKSEDFDIAIKGYEAFVQMHPAHPEVPYASFKIGQAHFKQIPNKWFLAPPTYERDQTAAREALNQLRLFTTTFPDDDRVVQANEMIKKSNKLLAQHEFSVAKFYQRRKAYRGVVGRIDEMLANYPRSGLDAEGLMMLGKAHEKLKTPDKAREAYQRILTEHPKSKYAKPAKKALQDLKPA